MYEFQYLRPEPLRGLARQVRLRDALKPLLALTAPLRWGSNRRAAKLLMAFSRAERSSFYDLLAAANAASSLTRRAAYLSHAVDEARHALMFALRAKELDAEVGHDPGQASADFEHLFDTLGESRFVAFVHHGEKRGRARLSYYRDEVKDPKTRAMLDAILVDEARHEAYTADLLTEMDAWPLVKRVRLWEAGRQWLRAGSMLSTGLFAVCMRILYFLSLPLALGIKWRRS
jgi:hypothetical protein